MSKIAFCGLLVLLAGLVTGGAEEIFTDREKAAIASLSLAALPPLPADPTNRFADDPPAAALGATLFFDERLSRDGTVSCGTCHVIGRQFQDDLPRAQPQFHMSRRTMPLTGVGWNEFFFWDGSRDSLWAQALVPLESQREFDVTRTAMARFMAEHFHERYERIFGPLPNLTGLPSQAGPFGSAAEQTAWLAMSEEERAGVDRVFANIGKAIAAFERFIAPPETRFDRFAKVLAGGDLAEADAAFRDDEVAGLKLFVGKAGCITCHSGPRFTDNGFHNTGIANVPGLPMDEGRAMGLEKVLTDPFNCLSVHSDDRTVCGKLSRAAPNSLGAFKTPSLRGVPDRAPYMHSGQIGTLRDVVQHYATAPQAVVGSSEIKPLELSDNEKAQLVAFLKTLD